MSSTPFAYGAEAPALHTLAIPRSRGCGPSWASLKGKVNAGRDRQRFRWETQHQRSRGVMGCEILQGLRGGFSGLNSAQPFGIAAHCRAFACWSPCVICCSRLQGLANLGGQLSTYFGSVSGRPAKMMTLARSMCKAFSAFFVAVFALASDGCGPGGLAQGIAGGRPAGLETSAGSDASGAINCWWHLHKSGSLAVTDVRSVRGGVVCDSFGFLYLAFLKRVVWTLDDG